MAQINKKTFLDINLQTKAGELVVSNQPCLIWNTNRNEIFLGNDLLKAIGIDPKTALEDVILRQQTPSCKENKMGLYTVNESVPDFGIDCKTDIDKVLKQKVNDCLANGMSERFRGKLMNLLFSVKNVWRRKLGPDAPAKVTPMQTSLIPGAQPVRCKARLYTKQQSDFLHEFTSQLKTIWFCVCKLL